MPSVNHRPGSKRAREFSARAQCSETPTTIRSLRQNREKSRFVKKVILLQSDRFFWTKKDLEELSTYWRHAYKELERFYNSLFNASSGFELWLKLGSH